MSKPKGRIVESQHGLFIFTTDKVYRYNPSYNYFEEIKFQDADGGVVASIGTSDDDPDID